MKFHWYSGQNNAVFVQYTSICLSVIVCINLYQLWMFFKPVVFSLDLKKIMN